jgi:hypothetical protein
MLSRVMAPAGPGHLARRGAGSDAPDEPGEGHDERGGSRVDLFAGWDKTWTGHYRKV